MTKKQTVQIDDIEQGANDIVDIILDDHKPLKKLIKTMKSKNAAYEERWNAFHEFAPLLTIHAKAEEKVLYEFLKDSEVFREQAFEGEIEHTVAEQVEKAAEMSEERDVLSAQIKVLAELVEHHIKEEEKELFPKFKRKSRLEDRKVLGGDYRDAKVEVERKSGLVKAG